MDKDFTDVASQKRRASWGGRSSGRPSARNARRLARRGDGLCQTKVASTHEASDLGSLTRGRVAVTLMLDALSLAVVGWTVFPMTGAPPHPDLPNAMLRGS